MTRKRDEPHLQVVDDPYELQGLDPTTPVDSGTDGELVLRAGALIAEFPAYVVRQGVAQGGLTIVLGAEFADKGEVFKLSDYYGVVCMVKVAMAVYDSEDEG